MAENRKSLKQADKSDIAEPVFKWTGVYSAAENSPVIVPAIQTQKRLMRELLPKRSRAYSLPEWHLKNRSTEEDDLLYLLCGVVHPSEYEMIHYYVTRWQRQKVVDSNTSWGVDDDERPRPIIVPRAIFNEYLKDQATFFFENHENLLLRLNGVKGTINGLSKALHREGVRGDPTEWVSAMDELLCQHEFAEQASVPADEATCWLWMNKMCAPAKQGLWKIDLSSTQAVLGELNWFQIYKSFADLWDHAADTSCLQRVNGELKKVQMPWLGAKILTALDSLMKMGFLNEDNLSKVVEMSKDERDAHEKVLKRSAVSALLTDLSKAAPNPEFLNQLVSGFKNYFKPILKVTGYPIVQQQNRIYKTANGRERMACVLNVSFYDLSDSLKKDVSNTKRTNADFPRNFEKRLDGDFSR